MKERLFGIYHNIKNALREARYELDDKLEWMGEKLDFLHSKTLGIRWFETSLASVIIVVLFVAMLAYAFVPEMTGLLIKSEKEEVGYEPEPVAAPRTEAPPSSSPPPAPSPPQQPLSQPLPTPPPSIPPEPEPVDFTGIPSKLSSTPLIQDFPSKVTAGLKFFTFVSGQRVWQNEYIITKGSVVPGKASNPDVIVILHSKYVNRIYNEDFCNVIRDANKNGDLGYESELSSLTLGWKFKSLIKYKSCLS
jgi:hypothetical protein